MTNDKKYRTAVVVPAYRHLSDDEKISMRQCVDVLGGHDIIVIHPERLDLTEDLQSWQSVVVKALRNEWFDGVKGYNSVTVNIAYTGGMDGVDNRTDEQKKCLIILLKLLRKRYPDAVIQGHRDFSPDLNGNGKIEKNEWIKMCPSFDAKTEYKGI